VFDSAGGVVHLGRSVDEARSGQAVALPLAAQARDSIAALFYARTLPLEPGGHHQFPVNEAGRSVRVELVVGPRETISVQNRNVSAVRLEPRLYQPEPERKPVNATLWLSADERRIPLALEVEAGFGRVRAELVAYEPGN
jgi:hypothetical protein